MRALAADIGRAPRAEGVDLDPEHVEVGDLAQDLEIPLGLGVEVEVEQDIDVRPRALAHGFQMHAQVAQHGLVDVELGIERRAEAGPPALAGSSPASYMKMLVLSAVNFFSRTSRPSALTPSRSVMAGLYQVG